MNAKYTCPSQTLTKTNYRAQRHQALKRDIEWNFTYESWCEWWMQEDRWANRGNRRGDIMMCRIKDVGPYDPSNVYAGTTAQNHADYTSEKRREVRLRSIENGVQSCRGEGHGRSKLSEKDVAEIRASAGSQRDIAKRYGVSQRQVNRIIHGQSWSHSKVVLDRK